MRSSFFPGKSILKLALAIATLSFPGYLFSQDIIELSSLEFYEQYSERLYDGSLLIIDGRTGTMFARERIDNAVNIDADAENLEEQLMPHLDQPLIVIYCTTMRRTQDIANKLRGIYKGEIICITDGIRGWKQNGLPVNSGSQISLDEAIEEALNNNNRLKSSKMMVKAASAGIGESEALFQPWVDANFQYAYIDIVPGFKRERLGNIQHTLFPFISAGQEIYSGGRNELQRESARLTFENETMSLERDITDVKLSVSIHYYYLISVINQKNIIQENLRHLDVHEQYTRLMIQAGRMSELEINRIAVERNALEGMLLKQENDISSVSHELCVLMGRERFEIIDPADNLELLSIPFTRIQLMETALANNPAWQEIELSKMQQELQIRIQESARMPSVSAQVWAGWEFGPESFSFIDNRRYFAGISAKMPIFDGGLIRSRTDRARATYESIEWRQQNFHNSLAAEMEDLYRRMEEMRSQVEIQRQSVEHARQSYRLAMIEYHAGRRSNTDLIDIQQALINSELQLNEAYISFNISRVRLLHLAGII